MYLYRAMFGREADDTGLTAWTGSLDQGMSREAVFNGFTGSAEWASICSSYGINPGVHLQSFFAVPAMRV